MDKIEQVKISKVKNNPNNPRLIKDDKFKKLVNSIKEFPEMLKIRPIVVNEDMIVLGGNMRLKACKEAGLKEVFIIKASELTEEQQREFIIKDNSGFGEWDWDMIANEWDTEQLEEWGIDLPLFDDGDVLEAEEDDFSVPDGGSQTDIVLGDLIEIGEHRLLCGDSTCSDTVAKLMNGEKADMVFTDPPYNVDYGNSNNPRHKSRTILNDTMSDSDWDDFVRGYMTNLLLFTNGNIYISMSDKELGHMQLIFEECGGRWASFIIWVKDRLVLSGKDYHSRHETILYGWNEKIENRLRVEDRKQDDVWDIKRPSTSDLHPTMKPIELIERMLINSSKKGMLIFDLFLGSGSTMVAAHQLNRKCYGMELDPKYCQVIIDRMVNLDNTLKVKINGKDYIKTKA
jgi:DNA modification methylase